MLILVGLYPVLWGKAEDSKRQEGGEITDNPSETTNSNDNTVEDAHDMDTAIDISRPLLQNGAH